MEKAIKEDEMELAMGSIGRWQLKVVGLMALLKFPIAWSLLGLVFIGAAMPHKCAGSNATCYDSSGHYCSKWTYDTSDFTDTIVSEWDLVCDRSQLVNVAQMTFMIGIIFGSMIFSIASDKWGRKKPLVFAGVTQVVTGLLVAFVPWYLAFIVIRFIHALAIGGLINIGFVLTMEVLNGRWRTFMATLSHLPSRVGIALMAVIAYYTRRWRYFQIAVSVPTIFIILYWWLVPESPRWLVAVGRNKEALELLQKVAKINGNPVPQNLPENPRSDTNEENGKNKNSLLDLFKTPNLRKITLTLFFNWANCGFCFYGLELYLSQTGGNIFINVAISGATMVPSILICMWAMDKFGRKITIAICQFVAAISCLGIILLPENIDRDGWWRISFSLIAVNGTSSSMITMFLYSTELFPTVVRNSGLGAGTICARIGSIIAPFAASLDTISRRAPASLFGTTSLIGAALILQLPETANTVLPNTLEEGEMFPKRLDATKEDNTDTKKHEESNTKK